MVDIFWVSEVIDKPYYVRSADENVGGSVGVSFVSGSRYMFLLWVIKAGTPELGGQS